MVHFHAMTPVKIVKELLRLRYPEQGKALSISELATLTGLSPRYVRQLCSIGAGLIPEALAAWENTPGLAVHQLDRLRRLSYGQQMGCLYTATDNVTRIVPQVIPEPALRKTRPVEPSTEPLPNPVDNPKRTA